MPMNPVWKVYLKINLVTIPVKMYNATRSTSLPSANTVEDHGRIVVDEGGYL
jgi:non-homologous end joining protein Ku